MRVYFYDPGFNPGLSVHMFYTRHRGRKKRDPARPTASAGIHGTPVHTPVRGCAPRGLGAGIHGTPV